MFKAVRPRRLGDVPGVCARSELGTMQSRGQVFYAPLRGELERVESM